MNKKKMGDWLIWLSVAAMVVSAFVFFTQNNVLNLAGTQWILIAIVLGIYGLYMKEKKAV